MRTPVNTACVNSPFTRENGRPPSATLSGISYLCAWTRACLSRHGGALGGGYFKPKEQIGKDGGRNLPQLKATNAEQVSEVLEKIAKKKGTLITSVALAYVMHKAPYAFPTCGGRKVDHLKGNIEALGLGSARRI